MIEEDTNMHVPLTFTHMNMYTHIHHTQVLQNTVSCGKYANEGFFFSCNTIVIRYTLLQIDKDMNLTWGMEMTTWLHKPNRNISREKNENLKTYSTKKANI